MTMDLDVKDGEHPGSPDHKASAVPAVPAVPAVAGLPVLPAVKAEEVDNDKTQPGSHPARVTYLAHSNEIFIRMSAACHVGSDILSVLPKDTLVFLSGASMERDSNGKTLMTLSSTWTPFPFLRLPSEIRNEVYKRVLAVSCPKHMIRLKLAYTGRFSVTFDEPRMHYTQTSALDMYVRKVTALLQTNRQMHQEGLAFLYGRNFFHFSQSSGLVRFLTNGPSILPFLRSVTIGNLTSSGKAQRTQLLKLLKDATGLREFTVEYIGHVGGKGEAEWIRDDFKNIMPFVDGMIRNLGSLRAAVSSIKFGTTIDEELQQLISDQWTEMDLVRQNEAKNLAARLARLRPRRRK